MSAGPEHDRVREHFDREAGEYDARSQRGLWKSFREREQRAVMELLRPVAGERVLDAGSGAGHYTDLLVERGCAVTALDLSGEMLASLSRRHGIPTVEADLCSVELAPEFDRIVCAGALEFVEDPRAAVRALLRGLRPDGPGVLVVLAPKDGLAGRIYRRFHLGHGFRVNLFSVSDIEVLAQEGRGFQLGPRRSATFNLVARIERTG